MKRRRFAGISMMAVVAATLAGVSGVDTAAAATQSFSTTVVDATRGVKCSAKNLDTTSRSIPVRVAAPTTPGPHPVVVVGHGFGQNADTLADAVGPFFAERGYIALVPRFPLSSQGPNFDAVCAALDLPNQAKDVSFVVTELLGRRQGFDQLPDGSVDADRIGMQGVSGGGVTALLFFNSCCTDPRIKAVSTTIGFPPLAVPTPWAWDTVAIPLFMVNATDDPVISYREARIGWEAAQPPKFFVTVPGGNPHGSAPGPGSPPAINTARDAFLDRYLKGDTAAGDTLVHAFDGVDPSAATFEYVLPIEGPPASTRLAGPDRVATAVATSADAFPAAGSAGTVVLARSTDYPDALAGAPLAAAGDGPVLLTPSGALDDRVKSEIERVLPKGGTVHLLGGTGALAPAVADAVRAMGYTVERHAGETRYETATAIASALGDPATVLLATGRNFPDALAAGAAAAESGAAILLTDGASMSPATSAYLAAHPSIRYAVGGPAATAAPTATAVAGADRYDTAAAVARRFFTTPSVVGAATGENFPDALGAGAHLAAKGGPLLLVQRTTVPATTRGYLADNRASITAQYVYGGVSAVNEAVRAIVHNVVSGSGSG